MNRYTRTLTTLLVVVGTTNAFAQPTPPVAEPSPAIIIMKDANGADRRCVIEKTWRLSDGTQAQLVRDLQSNETMTICDKTPSPAALEELSKQEANHTAKGAAPPAASGAEAGRLSPMATAPAAAKAGKPTTWLGRLFTRNPEPTPSNIAPAVPPVAPVAPVTPATPPHLLPTPASATPQPAQSGSGFRLFRWMQRPSSPSTSGSHPATPNSLKLPLAKPAVGSTPSRVLVPATPEAAQDHELRQWRDMLTEALLPSQREEAAEKLASESLKDHPEVVSALMQAAQHDPAVSVRASCIRCLAKLKPDQPACKIALIELSTDANERVREEAKEALSALGLR
jgi:hypothetical protein